MGLGVIDEKKNHAKLAKAVVERQPRLVAELSKQDIAFDMSAGVVTSIHAKDIYSLSRMDHVTINASRVGFECAVAISAIFKERYPYPAEQVERAFFELHCNRDDIKFCRDGDVYKMIFESLDEVEIIDEIRQFLEHLEDWHQCAFDAIYEANPVWGMNILE